MISKPVGSKFPEENRVSSSTKDVKEIAQENCASTSATEDVKEVTEENCASTSATEDAKEEAEENCASTSARKDVKKVTEDVKVERNTKLTPYQGKKRCFGDFECKICEKTWGSAFSWANTWQECKDCKVKVYPHKQTPLRRPKRTKGSQKNHCRDLCQKCLELGRPCYTIKKAVESVDFTTDSDSNPDSDSNFDSDF